MRGQGRRQAGRRTEITMALDLALTMEGDQRGWECGERIEGVEGRGEGAG